MDDQSTVVCITVGLVWCLVAQKEAGLDLNLGSLDPAKKSEL